MTKIDRGTVVSIATRVRSLVQQELAKEGLDFQVGTITFEPGHEMRFKVTIQEKGPVGTAALLGPGSRPAAEPKEGEVWQFAGKLYTIVGRRSTRQFEYIIGERSMQGTGRIRRFKIKRDQLLRQGQKIK